MSQESAGSCFASLLSAVASFDFAAVTWWELDLPQSSDNDGLHDGFKPMAIVGVMMCNTNAVFVAPK